MSDKYSNGATGGMEQPRLQYGARNSSRRPRSCPASRPPAQPASPASGLIDRSAELISDNISPEMVVQSGRLVVGQAVLHQYQQLMDAQKQREGMRESIVQLLQAGAPVEPGTLTAHLRLQEQRRFSAEQLERLLGANQVELLRSQLQPIVTVQLIVEVPSTRSRHR
jgi:hypothetical protein